MDSVEHKLRSINCIVKKWKRTLVKHDLFVPQARLNALDEQWQFLVNKSAEKSQKLKEANKQQNFNTGIKDFDFWLSEVRICMSDTCVKTLTHQCTENYLKVWCMFVVSQVEALLASEDYGKDLASVNNLLKKHQLLEADISAHEVCSSLIQMALHVGHLNLREHARPYFATFVNFGLLTNYKIPT